jgi:hypothetical protein
MHDDLQYERFVVNFGGLGCWIGYMGSGGRKSAVE